MSARWTQAEVEAVRAKIRNARPSSSVALPHPEMMRQIPERRSKYGNTKVQFQGQRFDSKRELKVWQDLKWQETAGLVRAVIRQVSLPLPGTTRRIRIDFLLIQTDGSYRWIDAKGFETAAWKGKRQQVREAYGIDIELL